MHGINGYEPRGQFVDFHNRPQRWGVLVCHRRAGKTVACIADLVLSALHTTKKDALYTYVAPLHVQAKDIAWKYLKRMTSDIPMVRYNESELKADLPNGACIRLYGAENADRLRGLYMDGVILDEYADMRPSVWGEVIRPLLVDRRGWAVFIGTPKGRNAFWDVYDQAGRDEQGWFRLKLKASESGLIAEDELRSARSEMATNQYEQEFECSFDAAITGAYYAKEIAALEEAGRITSVPYDPMFKVNTAWDLGISDSMSIWFFQIVGREIRVIDYYEASGYGLDHYARVLQDKGYNYGQHFGPHDIEVREIGTGKSRREVAWGLGINFTPLPMLPVADGINAARMTIPRCVFDASKTTRGLEALRQYREKVDEKRQISLGPLHDWSSHAADSWRYLCVSLNLATESSGPIKRGLRGIV